MMAEAINRQILLVETPKGKLGAEHFKMSETSVPALADDGSLLLRTHYISLDAANRAWMQGATYRDAVESGQVMAGGAIAEVIESKSSGFAAGDLVFADTGWQDYAVVPAKAAQKVPSIEPKTHVLSATGVAGLTATFAHPQMPHTKRRGNDSRFRIRWRSRPRSGSERRGRGA